MGEGGGVNYAKQERGYCKIHNKSLINTCKGQRICGYFILTHQALNKSEFLSFTPNCFLEVRF